MNSSLLPNDKHYLAFSFIMSKRVSSCSFCIAAFFFETMENDNERRALELLTNLNLATEANHNSPTHHQQNNRKLPAYGNYCSTCESRSVLTSRPKVILSYAQSLDGFIGKLEGQQVLLSGKEAMILTHAIRRSCDAILVGVNTVLNDNPKLTIRLVTNPTSKQPIPCVLDSNLRLPIDSNLITRNPLIFCSIKGLWDKEKKQVLEKLGCTVLPVNTVSETDVKLCIKCILGVIKNHGVNTLMVEGGASVVQSFLSNSELIDHLIVTIAPQFLRAGVHVASNSFLGIRASSANTAPLFFESVVYEQFGKDIVIISSL
jgi:2,5-diamino-6-(ribosylamino)-4(3H)-pyrimidinone 5'-phosphate reductase